MCMKTYIEKCIAQKNHYSERHASMDSIARVYNLVPGEAAFVSNEKTVTLSGEISFTLPVLILSYCNK